MLCLIFRGHKKAVIHPDSGFFIGSLRLILLKLKAVVLKQWFIVTISIINRTKYFSAIDDFMCPRTMSGGL